MTTSVPSPGGWAKLLNALVEYRLTIGAVGAAGVLTVFGVLNGRQASHFCNVPLTTASAKYQQLFSCPNPLTETGVILAAPNQGVFLDEAPTVVGTINIGVGATATASGNNIFDDLSIASARFYSLSGSGTAALKSGNPGYIKVGPGQYINGFAGTTSGASLKGEAGVGWVLLEIVPCSSVGIDC